ncbi:hypothetical protein A2U01_0043514, partial [Trifolium medium]|nr:hypothetical protein [Trifolium medium]
MIAELEDVSNDLGEKKAKIDRVIQALMLDSVGGRKKARNVPSVPMDNISFHHEKGASRWKLCKCYERAGHLSKISDLNNE